MFGIGSKDSPRSRRLGYETVVMVTMVMAAIVNGSCFFDTRTTFCEASGLRCPEGYGCTLEQGQYVCARGGCGDGLLDRNEEECDDGNIDNGDGCNSECRLEVCGNGVMDFNETCDDGNRTPGDGCSADCRLESKVCGNLIVDPDIGEECDSGRIDTAGCNVDCTFPRCGDNYANDAAGEECDTPDRKNTAECNGPLCTRAACGDSFYNPMADEECDAGGNTQGCNGNNGNMTGEGNCKLPMCGDGYANDMFTPPGGLGSPEACDTKVDTAECNGNRNTDGRGNCQVPQCGDGYWNALFTPPGAQSDPEGCDEVLNTPTCNGNDNMNGRGNCQRPQCGDGYWNPLFRPPGGLGALEACDSGGNSQQCNGNDNATGLANCQMPRCGDGYRNPNFKPPGLNSAFEDCDTGGNSMSCNGSDNIDGRGNCQMSRCGDGYRNPMDGEDCDKGDSAQGIPPILCTGNKVCQPNCKCM